MRQTYAKQLPADAFGYRELKNIDCRDQITNYTDGSVDVPLAAVPTIPPPYIYDAATQLAVPKPDTSADRISAFTKQLQDTVNTAFDHCTRDMFGYLYSNALTSSPPLTNRAAYCQQLATWGQQCYSAYLQAVQQVQSASSQSAMDAVTMTLPAPPSITLSGAMAVTN